MKNYLVRVISEKLNVLGLACVTTNLVDDACHLHGASPTACAALGRALTGASLMAALLKENQRLALKFEADGPLKKIIVEADSSGAVRGFVAVPDADMPLKEGKLDVSGALGRDGFLTVMKDIGLGEPYKGIVKLRTGGIAEDIAFYFAESEQIPSAVGLGVFVEPSGVVSASGGFLIQSLPPSDDELVDRLIARLENMLPVTQILRSGKMPEDILKIIFEGIPYHILDNRELILKCTCNRERIERVLISLGSKDIAAMIADHGEAEVTCEFCRGRYQFNREELELLLKEIENRF
ncbi:MAG TPA: Hsp33 family molecular chaperone HslO [Syntrophales bacterium]|nr:Hsp33 family molecular chaperone HslO [Syntrophales bacterium]